jgi:hypothetical protein
MYGTVQKYRLNVSKTLDLDNDNNFVWNLYQSVDAFEERDLWLGLKRIVNGSPSCHLFEEELGAFFTKHLLDLGYDSATFEEYGEDDDGTEHRSRTIVVLDPAKITKAPDFSKDNPLLQTRPLDEHIQGRSGEREKEEATRILAAEIDIDHPDVRLHAGLDPYDRDEDEDAVTEKDVWDWCYGQILDAAYSVTKNIKGDSIRCWRVITAPDDWNPEAQHPGMYWSWDKSAAAAHWGDYKGGHREWLIEADIPVDSVDWVMTFVMNANPEYEEEKEIRIFENAPVNIISIK